MYQPFMILLWLDCGVVFLVLIFKYFVLDLDVFFVFFFFFQAEDGIRDIGVTGVQTCALPILLSSLAALFTAGPAFGGEPFAESVQNTFGLNSDSYVWRTLCLLALLVSVGAAVLTNLGKAQDDVARLSSAEAANTELEGLAGLMHFGHLSVEDGVKLYQQYIVKIPFVDDVAGAVPGHQNPPPG